jgi:Ca2+-binding RTX toxin-like protein
VIVALGGQDNVHGGDGDDIICGGSGHDVVRGELGSDQLWGGAGRDALFGEGGGPPYNEGGVDTIHGGPGADRVDGGFDYDHLFGGSGADDFGDTGQGAIVHGGPGPDTGIVSRDPDDAGVPPSQFWGGRGNDAFLTDRAHGGPGADSIRLYASPSSSDLVAHGGPGRDTIDLESPILRLANLSGGQGRDRLVLRVVNFWGADVYDRIVVDLSRGTIEGDPTTGSARMRVRSFRDVTLAQDLSCADSAVTEEFKVIGTAASNRLDAAMDFSCWIPDLHLFGKDGNDILIGSDGSDRLHGGRGRDRGDGGAGSDVCFSVEAPANGAKKPC